MSKDTARVIVTPECNRHCANCVNKVVLPGVQVLHDIAQLDRYQAVVLTGGEPLLPQAWRLTLLLLQQLAYTGAKLYLYLGWHPGKKVLRYVLPYLDGLTYTLHCDDVQGSGRGADVQHFHDLQRLLDRHPRCEARLRIEQDFDATISVTPWRWSRIDSFTMVPPEDCPRPENEDLYLLEDGYIG